MITQRTIQAGGLAVKVELEGKTLRSVTLPVQVPPGLTLPDLLHLEQELQAFEIDYDRAPAFTRAVWRKLREVPAGQRVTYRELATAAGNPRAARAAGAACAANPHLLAIPCHRVVAQSGLGGFRLGLDWKRALLALEATA